jgi:hypothetical protein
MALRMTDAPAPGKERELDQWAADLVGRGHEQTVRASVADVAAFLQRLVGQKLAATIAGVDDPKAVGRWAREERTPRGDAERRTREAFQVAMLQTLAESEQTARS